MLADLKSENLMRLKAYVIHEMGFEVVQNWEGRVPNGVLELLAEYRIACEAFGVRVVGGPPKKTRKKKGEQ
jgi:hypothetical protein